jgi:hypothetical protein
VMPLRYPWEGNCICLSSAIALQLAGHNISNLPDSWGELGAFPRLQTLNLSFNHITTLPDSWGTPGSFSSLRLLDAHLMSYKVCLKHGDKRGHSQASNFYASHSTPLAVSLVSGAWWEHFLPSFQQILTTTALVLCQTHGVSPAASTSCEP